MVEVERIIPMAHFDTTIGVNRHLLHFLRENSLNILCFLISESTVYWYTYIYIYTG